MKILGIDYGRRKIGLAVSTEGKLATPFKVVRVKSLEEAVDKVNTIMTDEHVDEVVVGLSSGKMAEETKNFSKLLCKDTNIKISYQDENFTTIDAQELSLKAGIKRKKRKELEDAYSATIILQRFLDDL